MKKGLLAVLLSISMTLSSVTPAFAAQTPAAESSTEEAAVEEVQDQNEDPEQVENEVSLEEDEESSEAAANENADAAENSDETEAVEEETEPEVTQEEAETVSVDEEKDTEEGQSAGLDSVSSGDDENTENQNEEEPAAGGTEGEGNTETPGEITDPGETQTVQLEKIEFASAQIEMLVDGTAACPELIFTPENAQDKQVSFRSSDENVFTVDKNGTITAKGEGTAVLTASAANDLTAVCYVIVSSVTEYEIQYVLNGGVNNDENPVTFTAETETFYLKPATRTGYTFAGWYEDSEFTSPAPSVNKGTEGDLTFYAKWKGNTFTVKYVGNGATGGKMTAQKYTSGKGSVLTANAFTRKGYIFAGWNTKSDGSGTKFANKAAVEKLNAGNNKTITLYATWKARKYTITYKLNGGKNNKANPAGYYITSNKITFAKPTRKGYSFLGWYTDSKYKTKITAIAKGTIGNKTVYAKWKINKYTISYVLNGGKNASGNPTSYYVTTAKTLKSPTRTGYKFSGWYSDAKFTKKVPSIAKGTAGNLKLYAKWTPNKYRIIFKVNAKGKSYTGSMSDLVCSYGKQYTLPRNAFKMDDTYYKFMGWNTRADGKGKTYKNAAQIKNLSAKNGYKIILYGIWEIPVDYIYIDYETTSVTVTKGYYKKIGIERVPSYANESVTFTSSNKKIATVDSRGVIKGIKKGKVTITAKSRTGKKDTIVVNVVDNVRTWNPSYRVHDYDYGEPTVAPIKMYYSGDKLVLETLVANNRVYTADYFDYITITLFDSKGKQIAKKKFTNVPLNMGRYSTKKVKFVFDSAKKGDLYEGDYDYEYWYTFTY